MRRSKRTAGGLAAAVAVTALLLVTHDATATTAGATPSAGGTSRTVTLVTGDRVTVVDGSAVAIEPGDGRDGIAFQSRQVDGQFSVIPGDVIGLLSAGRLDPRLFNVTRLLEYGYDDRRGDLPLIVTSGKDKATVPTAGATAGRRLPRLNVTAMRQDRSKPGALWRSLTGGSDHARTLTGSVSKVWLDGIRRPALDVSVPQIGTPTAWQAGYTGSG